MTSFQNGLKTKLKFLFRYPFHKISNPVVIYQMGKVASSSIYLSLQKEQQYSVFHAHYLNPSNIGRLQIEYLKSGKAAQNLDDSLYLYKNLFEAKTKSVKIISLVREPISRNISAFFQNLNYYSSSYQSYDFSKLDEMISCFLDVYSHETPLTWFDSELKFITGVDIYDYEFPLDSGCVAINSGLYDILVMRYDLNDEQKEQHIAEFLGLDTFKISRVNEAASKEYFQSYQSFKNKISLPKDYVQRLLASKYAQHFHSSEELCSIYNSWTKETRSLEEFLSIAEQAQAV